MCGVKVFMGASTGQLLVEDDEGVERVLNAISRRAAFHSEDEYRLADRRKLARQGDWTSHYEVRDAEAAISSTRRLLRLARKTGKRIHVLHVTTGEEMEMLADAKDIATCEVTPQHLTLVGPEDYIRLKGYAQMNPPIRDAHHRAALWRAVNQGIPDVLGLGPRPAHERREVAALSGLALGHAGRADAGAGDADACGRRQDEPRALHRADQRRPAARVRHRRQGPHRAGL